MRDFSFKNLDEWQEEYLDDIIVSKLEKLGFSVSGKFERSNRGIIRGSIFASSRWGNIHAMAEKKDLMVFGKELENRLFSQLKKQKNKSISTRRPMSL